MHAKRVLKFGGSSLSDSSCFRRVLQIIRERLDLNPVVVVSALGAEKDSLKITDLLQKIATDLLDKKDPSEDILSLKNRHIKLVGELGLNELNINDLFSDFDVVVNNLTTDDIPDKNEALDRLMGFGEIFSSRILSSYLCSNGISSSPATPGELCFITDDSFQDADVLDESLKKIASYIISSKNMIIVPGYTGVTNDGRPTTLGRGGSDYTAVVMGAALKRSVEIWTDVDGIYAINPSFIPRHFNHLGHPATIAELSYDEAFQMASFGSKVLHQKTLSAVRQAMRKGKHIHLYIKNTFNPEHPGTVITSQRNATGLVRGITIQEGVQLLTLYPQNEEQMDQLDRDVKHIQSQVPLLASRTWGRSSFVFKNMNDELTKLESLYDGHLSKDQVLVKIVGDGIAEQSDVLRQIHGALARAENLSKFGMNIVHKSPQILTENTFEFIVKKRGLHHVLQILYKDLFMRDIVTVGILGLGTVGGGVIDYAESMYDSRKAGFKLNFSKALVRDPKKVRPVNFKGTFVNSIEDIVEDPLIDMVLELMGGLEPALSYILRAFSCKKDVVTANKALLSHQGLKIFKEAYEKRCNIGFEASVCAEIPIIDDFLNFPGLSDIQGIEGIVNGTSNYILTRFMEGLPFDEALKKAQELGFAEADPFMDVSGTDAVQKLSILASILFNQFVDYKSIPIQGIDGLKPVDGSIFNKWNVTVKPLVLARFINDKLSMFAGPAIIPMDHPLSQVNDENNALSLYLKGRKEPITKIGKGAGAIPTARSVVRDILQVSRHSRAYMVDVPKFFMSEATVPIADADSFESAWYLRFEVKDSPGVMGKIATVIGDFGLSINKIYQEENHLSGSATIQLELKESKRGIVNKAVELIGMHPFVKNQFYCILLK